MLSRIVGRALAAIAEILSLFDVESLVDLPAIRWWGDEATS